MKTKKFFMTSLLVMGMIIAKAANGFPPELVLVSQPVLTYNANSITIYYDVQNIGDYTYRGDIFVYLDPDNGYYYAKKYVRVCPGRIKRVAINIPAYRPNPSWTYTVMPYYELGDELYSFTTFEYFEPVRFCWNGYRDEPWVVIHVGPRVRRYHRPNPYRYYYDGYYPILPPPPGGYPPGYFDGMHPLDPMHHTYAHHHHYGGYPANHHPEGNVPGYNPPAPSSNSSHGEATVVRPNGSTPGSMSSNTATGNTSNTSNSAGATTRPTTNSGNSGNTGATTRPDSNSGRTDSGNVSRPSTTTNTSGTSNSGRTGTTSNSGNSGRSGNNTGNSGRNDSGNVSRPSSNTSSSGTSNSGRSGNSSSGRSDNSSSSRSSSSSSDRSSSSNSRSSSSSPTRGR